MDTTTTATNTPRIWLGCLNCYNNGRLVGEWYDAIDLYNDEDLGTAANVHEQGGHPAGEYCEEIWGFDHENMPTTDEMGRDDACQWGELYEELGDDDDWPIFCAWVADGNTPSVSEFADHYQGHWDDFRTYIENMEESCGTFSGCSELVMRYFDWDSYANDAQHDYTVLDAPQGVWVFSY